MASIGGCGEVIPVSKNSLHTCTCTCIRAYDNSLSTTISGQFYMLSVEYTFELTNCLGISSSLKLHVSGPLVCMHYLLYARIIDNANFCECQLKFGMVWHYVRIKTKSYHKHWVHVLNVHVHCIYTCRRISQSTRSCWERQCLCPAGSRTHWWSSPL